MGKCITLAWLVKVSFSFRSYTPYNWIALYLSRNIERDPLFTFCLSVVGYSSLIVYFHQMALSKDLYKCCFCSLAILKAISYTFDKSKELVFCPATLAEACFCITQNVLFLQQVVESGVS